MIQAYYSCILRMNPLPWANSVELELTLTAAEDAQQATMKNLRKDIELMENLMNQWHETKIQFEDAKHKLIKSMAEKEEKKKNTSGSSSTQSEGEKKLEEATIQFEAIRKKLNLTDAQIIQILEEKQQEAPGYSQPSKSSEQQEDAEDDSEKSKAAD